VLRLAWDSSSLRLRLRLEDLRSNSVVARAIKFGVTASKWRALHVLRGEVHQSNVRGQELAHSGRGSQNLVRYSGGGPVREHPDRLQLTHSGHREHHSITSSARASSEGGTARPSAFAVLRLITSSYFVGCSIGRSTRLEPLQDFVHEHRRAAGHLSDACTI
jgi:hypothetical protein